MDALARLLDGPRGRDAYLLRASLAPPWSVRLMDEAPLGLAAVVDGSVWFEMADGPPVELGPGDIVVSRGPAACTFSHRPGEPPQVFVLPGCVASVRVVRISARPWISGSGPGATARTAPR